MNKVILLTGSPATGKSTLRRLLSERIPNLKAVDYGQLLLDRKARQGIELRYEQLRDRSSTVIEPADVAALDEDLISTVATFRETMHILIDSHAVTREVYGFRAVPFTLSQLQKLRFDAVLVLRCDSAAIIARMDQRREGRQQVTPELAAEHQLLQAGLGLTYATLCGCPAYFLDTTEREAHAIADSACVILSTLGVHAAAA